MTEKIWVALIPAYEPKTILIDLLREIQGLGLKPIVVDDGSGTEYGEIFTQAQAYAAVLHHKENRGKGSALKTGLKFINEHFPNGCMIITIDADGQHRIADAMRVCKTAESHPDGLVLGSRRPGINIPLRSRLGNSMTRYITGLSIFDTQTGLRAFSSALLPFLLNVEGERYEYEMNMLLECSSHKIPIREVEIAAVYEKHHAASHFDAIKDSIRIYKEIIKFSASSFAGFVTDYTVYSLMLLLTGSLEPSLSLTLSNIVARVISAGINYTINRKLVFNSSRSLWKSAAQYAMLAALVLMGNTIVLNLLVKQHAANRFTAKILTEIIFFFLNWLAQRFIVFRKGNRAS